MTSRYATQQKAAHFMADPDQPPPNLLCPKSAAPSTSDFCSPLLSAVALTVGSKGTIRKHRPTIRVPEDLEADSDALDNTSASSYYSKRENNTSIPCYKDGTHRQKLK